MSAHERVQRRQHGLRNKDPSRLDQRINQGPHNPNHQSHNARLRIIRKQLVSDGVAISQDARHDAE
jgi:hypothetical protein